MTKESGYINYTFKMLYVLAIFMIVDGHIGQYDYLNLNGLLRYQNYHLALFIFASGYFLNLKRGYGDFIYRKTISLIIPLYLWNLFYGIVCALLNKYVGFKLGGEISFYNLLYAPLVDGHQYIYNMASWFLIPLFFIQLISFIILKPFEQHHNLSFISVLFFIAALGAGIWALHMAKINNGERTLMLALIRVFYFLPAYALGLLYRLVLEKYDTLNTPVYLLSVLSGLSILIYLFPDYNHVPSWLTYIGEPALIIYAISFLAIFFWLRIAKILVPVIKKSKTLIYISDHTFDIMMHHFVGLVLVKALITAFTDPTDTLYKTDIWYYPFIGGEVLSGWIYITGAFLIALGIGRLSEKVIGFIKK